MMADSLTLAQWMHILRQRAHEYISGTRTEIGGPEDGHATLALLDILDDHEHRLDAVEVAQADIDAAYELIEQQRLTIEALLDENDDLRAKLYVYERKVPPAEEPV